MLLGVDALLSGSTGCSTSCTGEPSSPAWELLELALSGVESLAIADSPLAVGSVELRNLVVGEDSTEDDELVRALIRAD